LIADERTQARNEDHGTPSSYVDVGFLLWYVFRDRSSSDRKNMPEHRGHDRIEPKSTDASLADLRVTGERDRSGRPKNIRTPRYVHPSPPRGVPPRTTKTTRQRRGFSLWSSGPPQFRIVQLVEKKKKKTKCLIVYRYEIGVDHWTCAQRPPRSTAIICVQGLLRGWTTLDHVDVDVEVAT
jgi:hypothetical protein